MTLGGRGCAAITYLALLEEKKASQVHFFGSLSAGWRWPLANKIVPRGGRRGLHSAA